jgi:hypothetical protein
MSQRNEALFEAHGVSPEHTHEQGVALGNALLIALGSGGPLSASEMEEFVSNATAYGATPEALAAWKRFDYTRGKISDHVELHPRLARHMLYEAIRICGAGAPPGPIAKLVDVARALGLDRGALAALEGVNAGEVALRRARADLSAGVEGRASATLPGVVASFERIAKQADKLRNMRISTMETGKPAATG